MNPYVSDLSGSGHSGSAATGLSRRGEHSESPTTGLGRRGEISTPQISRSYGPGGEPAFSFAGFRLEADGTLYRGETVVHLPPRELAALRLLLAHAGQIVTPAQLHEALWGPIHVTADSVPKCLSSLRARLEPEECIQTVYKRGYRLSVDVQSHGGTLEKENSRLAIPPFAAGYNVPEHLGMAVAEETIVRLTNAQHPALSVLARDSVFTLAHRGLTAQQIGEALKADFVLTGTLRALHAHFHLRAEMIRVEDGAQIWVEDLLVERDSIAGLESELANRLVFRLNSGALTHRGSQRNGVTGERAWFTEADGSQNESEQLPLAGVDVSGTAAVGIAVSEAKAHALASAP
jgi:DNA-binding winged helix-turn-helix (wHTH) protein